MSLHTGKDRTMGKAISTIIDYVENPDKTDGGTTRTVTKAENEPEAIDAKAAEDKKDN